MASSCPWNQGLIEAEPWLITVLKLILVIPDRVRKWMAKGDAELQTGCDGQPIPHSIRNDRMWFGPATKLSETLNKLCPWHPLDSTEAVGTNYKETP